MKFLRVLKNIFCNHSSMFLKITLVFNENYTIIVNKKCTNCNKHMALDHIDQGAVQQIVSVWIY